MRSCTSWNDAIGLPNCVRWVAYATDASRQPCTIPTQPEATASRPLSRVPIAILKPCPTSPRRAASGTRTSVRNSSAVAWPRSPSLPVISRASKPGESVGTRNAVTPRGPSSLVRAKTSATSAHVPLVMKSFWPSITQSAPSRVAREVRLPASDPVPGSVSPKQPSLVAAASWGSHSCFCSSVPWKRIDLPTSPLLTDTIPRRAESARPSSSIARE